MVYKIPNIYIADFIIDGNNIKPVAFETKARILLEEIRTWIQEKQFINGVHYDEKSIVDEIDRLLLNHQESNNGEKKRDM